MPTLVFSLASQTGRRGFAIEGDESGDNFGYSVASAGDVNGDGIDDLIINAPFATEDGRPTGDAYVIYGVDGTHDNLDVANLTAADGFWIRGNPEGGRAVLSVAGAGDVNGDGIGTSSSVT